MPGRVSGTAEIQEIFALLELLLLACCLILGKKREIASPVCHIGNIIAYKAADEPTDIMPILLILKAIIYEDEVHKIMK